MIEQSIYALFLVAARRTCVPHHSGFWDWIVATTTFMLSACKHRRRGNTRMCIINLKHASGRFLMLPAFLRGGKK
jgi:hypothetical protein